MSHRCTFLWKFVTACICIFLTAGFCFAAESGSGSSAFVYVGSSSQSGSATISGFSVGQNGSAQPVAGSPFTVNASQSTVAAPGFLFATNGQAIDTYSVAASGAISQTSSTNGLVGAPAGMSVDVLALDRNNQNLYASVVCSSCNNFYSGWSVNQSGQLSYSSNGSPLGTLSAAWGFAQLSFSQDDHYIFTATVCDKNGAVAGFVRGQNGSLTSYNPAAAPPLLETPGGGVGCSVDTAASSEGYLAVLWTGSYCCYYPGLAVATYNFNSNGTLNLVPGPANLPGLTTEYSMSFDPTGTYLAIAGSVGQNNPQGAIEIYRLGQNGSLMAVGPMFQLPAVTSFDSVKWDGGGHLYAITSSQGCGSGGCGLYVFNWNGSSLSLAPGSPYSVSQPNSLAVLSAP